MTEPLLRWAGGKRRMLNSYAPYLPAHYRVYYEPFLGSGALFFAINPPRARLSDALIPLINVYQQVKSRPARLLALLEAHESNHTAVGGQIYYYKVRSTDPATLDDTEKAARFIYLNVTCFNGLHRVNKKGVFNTPYGHRKNPAICPIEKVLACHRSLRKNYTDLSSVDYLEALTTVSRGDFVFLDPPYYKSFTGYTSGRQWAHEDHLELSKEFDRLVRLGAYVLLTNSDCQQVRELYQDYEVITVPARQSIKPGGSPQTELLVIGGQPNIL